MKGQLKFVLLVGLGAGILSVGASAQERQVNAVDQRQVRAATFDPSQTPTLQQADWDHRRCDGDHDRDDRGCYYYAVPYGYTGSARYGNGYYANGYYVAPTPYYAPRAGWYDRDGRWHAYDRDRDRYRRRYDDDRR